MREDRVNQLNYAQAQQRSTFRNLGIGLTILAFIALAVAAAQLVASSP